MTPPKLSDADKQTAVDLYRLPDETTASIANRYGVSPTTISRILKAGLSEQDYETLTQQKRSLRLSVSSMSHPDEIEFDSLRDLGSIASTIASQTQQGEDVAQDLNMTAQPISIGVAMDPKMDEMEDADLGDDSSQRRRRRRSSASASEDGDDSQAEDLPSSWTSTDIDLDLSTKSNLDVSRRPVDATPAAPKERALAPDDVQLDTDELGDDLDGDELDSDLELDDAVDDEQDDSFEDDFEEDGLADEGNGTIGLMLQRSPDAMLQVLPLSEAVLPRIAYLVIDRMSELVTHPLKDFGDLGRIAPSETQETTLPVFDNHRVARRFVKKNQKVVKVPDGKLLSKASLQLQSKGITRLLIGGQIYSI